MQISRHWRMNAQRYRLEGVRVESGELSLQARVATTDTQEIQAITLQQPVAQATPVKVA
ncbi:MAG: hypothetical protein SH821_06435 [Phototrophicales bacterium]|nr:hypothetical protein [Phototrophicales bacterium]